MKKFHRVIVALDNTDFDEHLIRYASKFTEITLTEKVYFLYVDRSFDIPKDFKITYKDAKGKEVPRDEALKKMLNQKVQTAFAHLSDTVVEIDVVEGSPLKELVRWAKIKDADLVILGNKKHSEGSGVVARKVARNVDCDLLFVPETTRANLKHLLVPIDFSEYSKIATNGAVAIAHEVKDASITALHVFEVPLQGYPTININYESFLKSMQTFKQEAFNNYIQTFDLKGVTVKDVYKENDPPGIAKQINRYAQEHQMDLIVVGAQGHTFFERILIGSVTEKLLTLDKEVPVLVLRK